MSTVSRREMLAGTVAIAATATSSTVAAATTAPDLSGKSILITGTSSGFGRLGALLYARQGARVFATMRNLPRPEADELRQIASDEELDLHVLPLDVRSDEQVKTAIADAERINGGPIDVLVNNAGVVIGGPVEVHDMEAVTLAFDTNVYGPHRLARAVLPAMRARKSGVIVNISSQQGRVIMPGSGVYAPTKFALEALSEQMAYELAPHGIEVVIIEPGGFPTNVGPNRARYQQALAARVPAEHASGYPEMMAAMTRPLPTGPRPAPQSAAAAAYLAADPIMVPQAIAEIIAMPAGTRPLRRAVHPGNKPQLEINRVAAESQLRMLGSGPYAEWAKAVLD